MSGTDDLSVDASRWEGSGQKANSSTRSSGPGVLTRDTSDTQELWRPACHFSPHSGWINDPNGLILIDGRYHAFYQYNPHATVHGPMHWGHAVSNDLVHWQELPVALYPDSLGQCYSGSAVFLPDGDVAIYYTAHLEVPGDHALQTQCLVRADRALERFDHEPDNPVLGNSEKRRDFRDPKVFWHAPSASWIMVVTLGRSVGIFVSVDHVNWRFASEFGAGLGASEAIGWECPDLVEVYAPDGHSRWVLIVGIWPAGTEEGSATQYFIGDFDGERFELDRDSASSANGFAHWLDHGRDYYAAQSFAGRQGQPPRVLAWGSNWLYANQVPTQRYRGLLTLPRDLSLNIEYHGRSTQGDVKTAPRAVLLQRVPSEVCHEFPLLCDADFIPIDAQRRVARPGSGVYRLSLTVALSRGEHLAICLFGEEKANYVIWLDSQARGLMLGLHRDKQHVEHGLLLSSFDTDSTIALEIQVEGDSVLLSMDLYVDNGFTELVLGDGRHCATMAYFPESPAGPILLDQHW
ncbi:MAG: glycoside hydrolase family 32 protein [Granulosicoccus sp.]|nr:glycoside hydrolase family 32 protein [Granulosicoccus sp.]